MFGFIKKKMYIGLLSFSELITSPTICVPLNNEPWSARNLFDLNHDEYNEGLCYYPCLAYLHIFNQNCNTLDDLSIKMCVPNNIEDVELCVLNSITRI